MYASWGVKGREEEDDGLGKFAPFGFVSGTLGARRGTTALAEGQSSGPESRVREMLARRRCGGGRRLRGTA